MHIEIMTENTKLADLLERDIPDGVKLVNSSELIAFSDGIPTYICILFDIAKDISVNLFAAWLYHKIVNVKTENITINRVKIIFAKSEPPKKAVRRIKKAVVRKKKK